MHKVVVLMSLAVAAIVEAAPQQASGPGTTPIPIVRYENEGVNFDGSYKWAYETGNGIQAQEEGQVKNYGQGEPNEIQSVVGSFAYAAPDGTPIQMTYTADERGFIPKGDHLPTPPPIPPAIQKLLDFIASQPSTPDPYANS